jgi:hypothetical protein
MDRVSRAYGGGQVRSEEYWIGDVGSEVFGSAAIGES